MTDKDNPDMTRSHESSSMPITDRAKVSAGRSLRVLILSTFFVELAIMIGFLLLPPLPPVTETVVDSTLLILLVSPIVYRFAIVPLHQQAARTNAAIDQLESLNEMLEQRVSERTAELELVNQRTSRRAAQMQSITELSGAISQMQDLNEILPAATILISERFGFYHVGIFLIDESREYATLQASNSEGGKRMLERGHRLRLGTGVVGFAAQTSEPRIALDVGADSVFFDNPDLPGTRSEAAIPLRARGETLGVLDVQSLEPGAFSSEDLQVLTALATQVAIALDNTRLLTETRAALIQAQEVYREFTRTEWGRTANRGGQPGFRYQAGRIEIIEEPLQSPEAVSALKSGKIVTVKTNRAKQAKVAVAVPVKLRGEVIGLLHIESGDPGRKWQEEEISLMEAVAERAAGALENARLFQDARQRAAKERLISQATSRISSALNIENILHTTAEELERVLGGAEVLIQFQSRENTRA